MPAHIGIVGCSAEGAALCYRTICNEGPVVLGPHAHPEVSMHTHSLARYVACLEAGNVRGVADLMLSSAEKLAAAGAGFPISPDNTIHQALPYVEPRSPLPWLNIAAVVAGVAAAAGFKRVGLLGTRWLVESDVYPRQLDPLGIKYVRPESAQREHMNRIIMEELVCGVNSPQSTAVLQMLSGASRTRAAMR